MGSKMIFKLAVIACCIVYGLAKSTGLDNGWTLRVLHTNDMHARFEETSAKSGKCTQELATTGKCYGGFARLATLLRQARTSSDPTIFLNAGDTYRGTLLYKIHKWEIVSRLLNILEPNVTTLGNHEFDEGVEGLIPFLNKANFPIVAANLDLKDEPGMAATKLKKSHILEIADRKVGVVGYVTPTTQEVQDTGKVIFLDEVESVREEVERLRHAGINIIIALGHSGFDVDKKIAAQVDGVDLVIGAHDNTFLYNGDQPDREKPVGPYPTEVSGVGGRKVYCVQAYAYTKYLGDLRINFDSVGEIKSIHGNPILVDSKIEKAKDVEDVLQKEFRPKVDELLNAIIGSTRVFLDGDKITCRIGECTMGNLIVDAMIDYNIRKYDGSIGWTDAAIAMHTAGAIQRSIAGSVEKEITMGEVIEVLPFEDDLVKIDLTGKIIREMLEHSVSKLNLSDTSDLPGYFMHFSGLVVEYDLSKPIGSKVVSVLVLCADCSIPIFEPLDKNKTYKVLTVDFIARGKDGFKMVKGSTYKSMGVTTDRVLADYIKHHSPVFTEIDMRIKIHKTGTEQK